MPNENEIPMSEEMKILTENGVWYKTDKKELEEAMIKSMHDFAELVVTKLNESYLNKLWK